MSCDPFNHFEGRQIVKKGDVKLSTAIWKLLMVQYNRLPEHQLVHGDHQIQCVIGFGVWRLKLPFCGISCVLIVIIYITIIFGLACVAHIVDVVFAINDSSIEWLMIYGDA